MKEHHSEETDRVEIAELVRKFEACEVQPADFKHRHHLTVSAWYLSRLTEGEATERMRAGLLRLIKHFGVQGYNETITLFWMKRVGGLMRAMKMKGALEESLHELLERCGNSQVIFDYYSCERVNSAEAKASWVEPDFRPLDF